MDGERMEAVSAPAGRDVLGRALIGAFPQTSDTLQIYYF